MFFSTNQRSVFWLVPFFLVLMLLQACSPQKNYTVSEVSFENGEVSLSASLMVPVTVPEDGAPAVIFVPGSGNNTRAVFRPLAEWYVGHGFVALFYDKRGSGQSGGSWISASLEDLAGDVVAGLRFLEDQPEVDPDRIGVWAVSQGGWVLPVAAEKSDVPSWAIVVSGGGASPRETEIYAYTAALKKGGMGPGEIEEALALVNVYFDYLGTGRNKDEVLAAIQAAKTKPWYEFVNLGRIMPSSEEGRLNWAWVANFDALEAGAGIPFPVLAMIGGQDHNLPPEAAIEGWREAFRLSGVSGSKAVFFPDGGHGLGYRGHEAAKRGEYVEGYFDTQENWLKEIGVIK